MKKFIAILICTLVLISCCAIIVSAEDTLPYEIEGVELLSTETPSNDKNITEIVCLSIIGLASIGGIIITLCCDDDWGITKILFTICLCAALLICITGIILDAIVLAADNPTTYKVTISDGVDYVEFTEHYKEIGCEGKIHTIVERK